MADDREGLRLLFADIEAYLRKGQPMMRVRGPRRIRYYCRTCHRVQRFVYNDRTREFEAECGRSVHPMEVMVMYSIDDVEVGVPPTLLLPRGMEA